MNRWHKVASVAQRLKEAMMIRKVRQTDLVRETGIAKGTISNYTKGKYEPKAPSISKLSKALNCSDMWLMGYDVPMERHTYVDDAEFLDSLPPIHPKQDLPPELEAVNVLLASFGRQIIKTNDAYYMDEAGLLSDEEVNDLINVAAFAVKNATDAITARHTNEMRDFLRKKNN